MAPRLGNDEGSATLELVVWAPVLMLVMSAILLAGRVAQAHQAIEVAAAEAARAASAADTLAHAQSSSHDVAAAALTSSGLHCADSSVSVDTSQWSRAPGSPARVEVTIRCRVGLADLAVPGLPGTRLITATAASSLDTYRVRR